MLALFRKVNNTYWVNLDYALVNKITVGTELLVC